MEIKRAENRHIEDICEIERLCFSTPWDENAVKSEIEFENGVFLVCEEEGKAIGYISMRCVLDEGYINNVAVTPDFRRQGIGEELIKSLVEEGIKKKLSFITLEVRESNVNARRLYEKQGFKEAGKRKRFYRLPDEDGILYTLEF